MDDRVRQILNRFIYGPRPEPDRDAQHVFAAPKFLPSGEMQKLEIAYLRDWIGHQARRKDLPIYKLAPEVPALALPSGARALQPSYFPQRLSASGLWRVVVGPSPGLGFEAASASGFQAIRDAGLAVDQRQENPRVSIESSVIVRSVRSRLKEHDLPVLGPGGHVTAYQHEGELEIDVVVRKRAGAMPATVRPAEEVADFVERRIAGLSPGGPLPRLWAGFGYFELSKYDRQQYLRPAYVVAVTFPDEDGSTLFSSVLVEPASVSSQIPAAEGLGNWSI